MTYDPKQGDFCSEQYGFTNPLSVDVPCRCKSAHAPDQKCAGKLYFDEAGYHVAFLVCSVCGCTYALDNREDKVPLTQPTGS